MTRSHSNVFGRPRFASFALPRGCLALCLVASAFQLGCFRPTLANEVMQDRCSGDVAFPYVYDGPPVPNSFILSRANRSGARPSALIQQKLDGSGHIRWWCSSTTGNWVDPGTYVIDEVGVVYTCGDQQCTATGDLSAHPVDVTGWTAERSRCADHSDTVQAVLGPNRSLQMTCLGHSGSTRSPLVVVPPDAATGHFAPTRPGDPAFSFAPVRGGSKDAWQGNFVYPRGTQNDARINLAIGPQSSGPSHDPRFATRSYQFIVAERSPSPAPAIQLTQDADLTLAAPQREWRYMGDYLSQPSPGSPAAAGTRSASGSVSATEPAGGLGAGRLGTPGLRQDVPSGGNAGAPGPSIANRTGAHNPATLPANVGARSSVPPLIEEADTVALPDGIALMLYAVHASNASISGYSIRYLRRAGSRVVEDVMLFPPVEAPH
jgi:hypothetical protein